MGLKLCSERVWPDLDDCVVGSNPDPTEIQLASLSIGSGRRATPAYDRFV